MQTSLVWPSVSTVGAHPNDDEVKLALLMCKIRKTTSWIFSNGLFPDVRRMPILWKPLMASACFPNPKRSHLHDDNDKASELFRRSPSGFSRTVRP